MDAFKHLKHFKDTIVSVVAIISGIIYLNVFVSDLIVGKEEFLIATTEIRIGQVEHAIRNYQRIGIPNLSGSDSHTYDLLLKQQEKLNEKRDSLLGL